MYIVSDMYRVWEKNDPRRSVGHTHGARIQYTHDRKNNIILLLYITIRINIIL